MKQPFPWFGGKTKAAPEISYDAVLYYSLKSVYGLKFAVGAK